VLDLPATEPRPESSELRRCCIPFSLRIEEKFESAEEVEMMMERASRSKLREGSSRGRVVGNGSGTSDGREGAGGKMAERMSRMRSWVWRVSVKDKSSTW